MKQFKLMLMYSCSYMNILLELLKLKHGLISYLELDLRGEILVNAAPDLLQLTQLRDQAPQINLNR